MVLVNERAWKTIFCHKTVSLCLLIEKKKESSVLELAIFRQHGILECLCRVLKPLLNVSLERQFLKNVNISLKAMSPLHVQTGEMGTITMHMDIYKFETIEASFFLHELVPTYIFAG